MITVLIVDDQPVIRQGFSLFLQGEKDIEVVGQADTGLSAVEMAVRLRPQVILMDVRMPEGTGLWATQQLLSPRSPIKPKIIVVTTFDLDEYVFKALDSGASGFLLKDADPDELANAIRTVSRGGSALSSTLMARLFDEFARRRTHSFPSVESQHELTQREVEIVKLLSLGYSNQAIAETICLEISTVKSHVGNISAKLKVGNRVQIVIWAFRTGIACPPDQYLLPQES